MKCSCCGADNDIQMHHLYPKSQGCPDDLMVPLCYPCHRKAHGLNANLNHSELTKEGLRKAKERGVKMGGLRPRTNEANLARVKQADYRAKVLWRVVKRMRDSGMTLQTIADKLNEDDVATANKRRWHPTTVKNIIDRVVKIKEIT